MINFTISKPNFSPDDIARIDSRLRPFLTGWKLVESWEGNPSLVIPDYVPFNYDVAVNKPEGINDDEMQLWIWCGWAGRSNGKDIDGLYDAEAIITVSLNGAACTDDTIPYVVHSEQIKAGGTSMELYFRDKLVTDFMSISELTVNNKKYKLKYPNGYQTVPDLRQYL